MLLIPKNPCTISRSSATDVYGQAIVGDSFRANCGVVRLDTRSINTSVRADSSASRGNAREVTANARLLFSPDVDIRFGDKIKVGEITLRVVGIFPRHTVVGKLDHLQVDADIWV